MPKDGDNIATILISAHARTSTSTNECSNLCPSFRQSASKIEKDIRRHDMSIERVVAGIVRLLDLGKIRVRNSQYARDNKSFGATTLRSRHAKVAGSRVKLEYMDKSGKLQQISIDDRRLSTIIRQCHDLPGQSLFQYVGNDGTLRPVTSSDVNDYLKRHAGEFTAKDFAHGEPA